MTKYLIKSTEGVKIYSGSQFEGTAYHVGKLGQKEPEAADHMVSTVSKQ